MKLIHSVCALPLSLAIAFTAEIAPPGRNAISTGMIATNPPAAAFHVVRSFSTNWLPLDVPEPNGDGTTSARPMEVGVVILTRHGRIVTEDGTNLVMLSAKPVHTPELLIRPRKTLTVATNTNWQWRGWDIQPMPGVRFHQP